MNFLNTNTILLDQEAHNSHTIHAYNNTAHSHNTAQHTATRHTATTQHSTQLHSTLAAQHTAKTLPTQH